MKHSMNNYFAALNDINVSDHVEKKGQFSYLSWPFAVTQLRLADPSATWEVKRFDGLPYLKTDGGYFVPTGKALVLGFKVTALPTDSTQKFSLTQAVASLVAKVSGFDIPTTV